MTTPSSRATQRVVWLTTAPAAPAAPTVAEIGAGTDLDPYMVADSLSRALEGQTTPLQLQHTRFDAQVPAGYGGQPVSAQFVRHSAEADDAVWELVEFGADGTLVITDSGFTGAETTVNGSPIKAPVAGDRCEVWPSAKINAISPQAQGMPLVSVSFAIGAEPVLKAVVAA